MLFVDSDMEDDDDQFSSSESVSDISNTGGNEQDEGDDNTVDDPQSEEGNDEVSKSNEGSMDKKKQKKIKKKKNKTKISDDEAKDLREKEHTYSSNLYRVQIEELLKETSISDKRRKEVQEWFNDFKAFVLKSKSSKSHALTDYKKILNEISLPLSPDIIILADSTDIIKWMPPSDVSIVGSWETKAVVDKISYIDIALELRMEFYRKKDFLNHRYHIKRAIYLAYLARLLQHRGDDVKFTLQQGNPTKPAILIQCNSFKVKIITSVPSLFKPSRLSPNINNLRFLHFFQTPLPDDEPEVATPNYNSSILTDVLIPDSQTLIYNVLGDCDSYTSAAKLIKIWLHQRGLDKGFGSFTGFIASAFIVYLSSTGKIDRLMTPYNVLRIFFSSLAHLDLTVNGIGLCSTNTSFANWHLQFDVVFLDSSGNLNYTADMSEFTFKRVQREAQRALEILGRNKLDGFSALFLTPVPFIQNFDHILQLSCCDVRNLLNEKNEKEQLLLNHSGFQYPVIVSIFGPIIKQCLGSRVHTIDHELISERVWNLTDNPTNSADSCIKFGFIINREAAYKLIEKCDVENIIQSQSFKDFWGERCQLRRFKDGTMCETVAFEDKCQIMYQMLSYIFQLHFDLKGNMQELSLSYIDSQIEHVIEKDFNMLHKLNKPKTISYIKGKRKNPSVSDLQEIIPCELYTICNNASLVLDDLSKVLRSLAGLPLEVSTVQGTSSILRFTSVHPTPAQNFPSSKCFAQRVNEHIMTLNKEEVLSKVPKVVEPIAVVLHLETSGKWPDDIDAVDRLKCAFLTRIGQLLNDQFGLTVQVYPRFLDIFKDGFLFRVKLTHYRELVLLKQHLGPDGVLKVRDSVESSRLEKETLLLPQLTTTLHSFHRQFEAFGKTARLAKRWIASQLLLASPLKYISNSDQPDCRFTEESIELIVAHMFMSFSPYLSHPNEGQVGFLRFLSLLTSVDWKVTPLVLNFHEKMSIEEMSAIDLDFVRRRSQLPPLFIATPEDMTASVWTKHLEPVLLYRAQLLAKEALKVLEACLESSMSDNSKFIKRAKNVFRVDTNEFDILIHLKKSMNPLSYNVDANNPPQFHEYIKSGKESLPIIDFDPVQMYLSQLRSAFGDLALFLHDTFGGSYIAVVWKPESFKNQDFAISTINTKRAIGDNNMATNVDEIIESFEILGVGLVERIENIRS